MEWFKIDWKKYVSLGAAERRKDADNRGIYVIYEVQQKLPIKVLYVGETYSQTFAKRLRQHKKEWLFRYEDIDMAISFGTVHPPKGKKISQAIVFDCEGILIHHFIPPCNTSGKKRYTGRGIVVFNTGHSTKQMPSILTNDNEFLASLRDCPHF